MAFLLNMPTGRGARASQSEIIRLVSELLKKRTDLFLQQVEPFVVADCQGRLNCIAQKVRRDYRRQALVESSGEVRPFSEHLKTLKSEGRSYPQYLMMVSVIPGEKADRIRGLLLDTDRALTIFHEAKREVGWKDSVEVLVSSEAVLANLERSTVRNGAEMERYLQRMFRGPLKAGLGAHWEPYGELTVTSKSAGAQVILDGDAIGLLNAGTTRITGIRPGDRVVRIERAGFAPMEKTVRVRSGRAASVEVSMVQTELRPNSAMRAGLLWTGVAAAAAGIATTIYAITRQSDVRVSCFTVNESCKGGSTFITNNYAPENVGTLEPINPGGVALAPLGFSLVAAGAGWALSTWLMDDKAFPWLEFLIGVAAGGATYGISVAAQGSPSRIEARL